MFLKKQAIGASLLLVILSGSVTFVKAAYYQPDFFPIGLSGIMTTGNWSCPYGDEGWTWQKERQLIEALGVNCLGCADIKPSYLIDLKPLNPGTNNYLHQVCALADPDEPVYLIIAGYYAHKKWYEFPPPRDTAYAYRDKHCCQDVECDYHYTANCHTGNDYRMTGGPDNIRSSTFFRSPHRPTNSGYGSMLFDRFVSVDESWGWHGTHYENWDDFDGDDRWRWMADTAVGNFKYHFLNNPDHANYIWGYNLITEDPGIYQGGSLYGHGCWAAVDRVFTGHRGTTSRFALDEAPHYGIRGAESAVMSERRMIVAKGGVSPLLDPDINIFQYLPDLDAFVCYNEPVRGHYRYGDQRIFDAVAASQNTALYFKQYGDGNLAYGDQQRRWIVSFGISWRVENSSTPEYPSFARQRRPCPTELRCMAYLALSRGAKGVLYHYWSGPTTYKVVDYIKPDGDTVWKYPDNIEPYITIPATKSTDWTRGIGMRDYEGYPFGYGNTDVFRSYSWYTSNPQRHRLNNGQGGTYWHDHNWDTTYNYLANTLIPEIKRLAPWLVQLEWDTAFSRDCTIIFWSAVRYVKACRTRNICIGDHIDVGFFKDATNLDYFMVVNRCRIAPNKLAKIRIEIDDDMGRSDGRLFITDLRDTTVYELPHENNNPSKNYLMDWNFTPGQGRLFAMTDTISAPRCPVLGVNWVPVRSTQGGPLYPGGDDPGDPTPPKFPYTAYLYWWFDAGGWEFGSYKAFRHHENFWSTPHHYERSCEDQNVYWTGDEGYWYVTAHVRANENAPWRTRKSRDVISICPGDPDVPPPSCPMLYSYWKEDTLTDVYAFLEENTILPHSEQACTTGTDFLVLNNAVPVLNGHYFLNISENADEVSFIDEIKLWVVDHPEGTQVGTTAEGEILTYSDLVFPYTCFDQNLVERRNEMLDPEQSFMGNDGENLILDFPNNGWTSKALLVGMKTLGGEPYPEPKDCFGSGSHSDGDTSWIPDGYALTRQNPGTMLIDVSEDTSYTYRIDCVGDSVAIDYVFLVKLEDDWTQTEAVLDSALLWKYSVTGWQDESVTQFVFQVDSVVVELEPSDQLSLRFDSIPADTLLRDFVLQTSGFYVPNPGGGGGQSGPITEELEFALEITANPSLTDAVILRYTVPYAANVEISVYDVTGRLVNKLADEEAVRGKHEIMWHRTDSQGRSVASGTYFIRMESERFEKSVKITILR